jgi:hypothetical protein
MSRKNGGIIGPANTPVGGLFKGVAGGVWRMNDVVNFVGNSQWPSTPKSIDNSCRFNSGSSDFLSGTFSNSGNRRTFTISFWIKRASIGSDERIIEADTGTNGNNVNGIEFDTISSSNRLRVIFYNDPSVNLNLKTNELFSDLSAWYHIVLAIDTTQSTSSDRAKLYVNGSQITSFETATYPSQNYDADWNVSGNNIRIGRRIDSSPEYLNAYLAETVFIDGQALTASSFGETDSTTGIWKPKKIGSFSSAGDNSFYLDFKDSSNLGNDASGLNNDLTVNNLTSIDQSTDTCVVNYATINPLNTFPSTPPTISEGNLQCRTINADPGYFGGSGTIGVSTGKWYFEVKPTVSTSGTPFLIGVSHDPAEAARQGTTASAQYSASEYVYYGHNGNKGNSGSYTSYGNSYAVNDIIGVALDLDNHKIYFSKNGTFQNSGVPTSGSTGTGSAFDLTTGETYFPFLSDGGGSVCTYQLNFGSPPYSISSGNSDANGHGNFEYAVPSGYYALNTSNLNTYG